jgi:putative transposase
VNHLRHLLQPQPPPPPARNGAAQRRQRQLEQATRQHAVQALDWLLHQGWTQLQAADLLHLSDRTLRCWRQTLRVHNPPWHLLGRPPVRSPREQRNDVIQLLDELGPGLGLPTLRDCFPEMARAELADLLRRYRRVYRARHQQPLRILHWTTPGSVWAIDFAEPPRPIDGRYAYLLAVRDLASGQQLLWLPINDATSPQVVTALTPLFVVHGAPLVLKSDNGSAFGTPALQALLAQFGVHSLFSPPYTPAYNGSIEAGIGSLKTRTEQHATRQGHPGYWTCDDAAAAAHEANATARPRGPDGPTPAQAWQQRRRLTALDRALFQTSVGRLQTEARRELGHSEESPLDVNQQRQVDRIALRRALEEHGYLLYSRRRIPLSIRRRKAARIT